MSPQWIDHRRHWVVGMKVHHLDYPLPITTFTKCAELTEKLAAAYDAEPCQMRLVAEVIGAGAPVVVAVRLVRAGGVGPSDRRQGGSTQVRAIEFGVGEVDACQVSITQVRLAEVDPT